VGGAGAWPRSAAEEAVVGSERIGKFARPKRIIWADDLPKTRSGKIMRRLLRDIAEGRALGDATTLRDPAVMGQLEDRVKELQAQED
jgi:acetyl-CoA synthetase